LRAREMLEFSRTSIDKIAASVGPSEYRQRFCRITQKPG
jgi:transcriptional regulator GlxA family with amidase domain